jgi:hypothetical protein
MRQINKHNNIHIIWVRLMNSNKRFHKLLLVAGTTALTAGLFSSHVTAATVDGNASATVLTPLSIALGTNAMNFGDVAGDADVDTTVVLTTAGATSSADGASVAGTPLAGDFDVTGSGVLSYSISLPADSTVTLTGPGTAMPVDGFTDSLAGSGTLTAGSDSFTVGATLTINSNQTAGAYSGTYTVIVNYQ